MSIKTTYTCDKCGGTQETATQFWNLGVTANIVGNTLGHFVCGKVLQVCRPCLESFGLYVQTRSPETPPPPTPTIEDLIRDIIDNATADFNQGLK